jgi:hypothetical protein
MTAERHPKKEIRKALKEAEEEGWIVELAGGRSKCWGQLRCGSEAEDQCRMTINSTPKVPENEAKKIRRGVARCPHQKAEEREQ